MIYAIGDHSLSVHYDVEMVVCVLTSLASMDPSALPDRHCAIPIATYHTSQYAPNSSDLSEICINYDLCMGPVATHRPTDGSASSWIVPMSK
jgi:hypothetical protein